MHCCGIKEQICVGAANTYKEDENGFCFEDMTFEAMTL